MFKDVGVLYKRVIPSTLSVVESVLWYGEDALIDLGRLIVFLFWRIPSYNKLYVLDLWNN